MDADALVMTFLNTVYVADYPSGHNDLTTLITRYLRDNPQNIAEMTARLKDIYIQAGAGGV